MDRSLEDQLYDAAEDGDAAAVRALLRGGVDPNAAHSDAFADFLALHKAAEEGHAGVVELLLKHGADVHATEFSGHNALHYAAEEGRADVVRLLLDRGADLRAATDDGFQPLHFVACGQHVALVKLLIARGADVRASAGTFAETPLHMAVQALPDGWHDPPPRGAAAATARALLDAGASVTATDSRGWQPSHSAANYAIYPDGASALAALLQRGADARAVDADGRTPLHLACNPARGWTLGRLVPKVAEQLLKHGADPRAADDKGRTPLHCLAARDVSRGVERVDDPDGEEGDDAEDTEAIVEALKAAGADVNAANAEGRTPLMLAAKSRNSAAGAALLQCGARFDLPPCERCADADGVRARVQAAVVGMAGEAARLQRQQATLAGERAAWEQERVAWQQERAAIEAARGGRGGGLDEAAPAAKRARD